MIRNIPGRCTGARDVKYGKRASGEEQIGLLFEITEGEHKGTRLSLYAGLESDEAIQFVRRVLVACGWDSRSWSELRGLDRNGVMLVVEEERDARGIPRLKLRYVNPMTAVNMRAELAPEEVQSLVSRLDRRERESAASEDSDSQLNEPPL